MLGGYGYMGEYVVERLWRDAKLLEIGGGTLEAHHKNLAAIGDVGIRSRSRGSRSRSASWTQAVCRVPLAASWFTDHFQVIDRLLIVCCQPGRG